MLFLVMSMEFSLVFVSSIVCVYFWLVAVCI